MEIEVAGFAPDLFLHEQKTANWQCPAERNPAPVTTLLVPGARFAHKDPCLRAA